MCAGSCKGKVQRSPSVSAGGVCCAAWYACMLCFLAGLISQAPRSGDRAQPRLLRTHVGTTNLGSSPSLISFCLSGTSCLLHPCCSRLPVPFSSLPPPSFASPGPSVIISPQALLNHQWMSFPRPTSCPLPNPLWSWCWEWGLGEGGQ